jgi:hypothetical protein
MASQANDIPCYLATVYDESIKEKERLKKQTKATRLEKIDPSLT